jgi:mono/diheme cytochrome c family protein
VKTPSLGILALATIGGTALLLAVLGAPHDRPPPPPVARPTLAPASVAAGGITLSSVSVDLPAGDQPYPAGPHADLVNAHCAACHSPDMVLVQPPLSADQWTAEVTKMREVYKAPVAAGDTAAIVAYLVALPQQQASTPKGQAQDPDPKAAPRLVTAR